MPREDNICHSDVADQRTPLNFIDLFCGCGGFTVGMERAGFKCLAAIDFNVEAVTTMQANLSHIKHVLHRDLTVFTPDELLAADHPDGPDQQHRLSLLPP